MNSLIKTSPKAKKEGSNKLLLDIFRDALISLAKFISIGFGGAIGFYLLIRQWMVEDWQALALSIVFFIIYILVAMTYMALRRAVSEHNYRLSLAYELTELQKRKEALETELKISGLYVQNDLQLVNELQADGFWTSNAVIEIEVVGDGELGIISHWNKEAITRNTTFNNYEFEASVLEIPQGHRWHSEVVPKSSTKGHLGSPNYVDIQFYIDPPLTKGDRTRYRYTQKYKGIVSFSLKDLEKNIKSRPFLRHLLKEIKLYSILCPTKRFFWSILFHDSSLISNIEVVALYRNALDREETERARNYFTVTIQANEQIFACLEIPQAKVGYMYGIMWSLTK